jgi:endonuclease/exonuclease/phosphatase family metal-dependent hydrolase
MVTLPSGTLILVAVTHLHHPVPDAALRDQQTAELVAWLDAASASVAQVVVGDFNADPEEPAYGRMVRAGFRSAHAEANGAEPRSPGRPPAGPAMTRRRPVVPGLCLLARLRAIDARLWADGGRPMRPLPSDHFGSYYSR